MPGEPADAWGAQGFGAGGITVSGRMICPTCGAEYDAGELFCGRDGSRLQPLEEADVVHGAPAPTSSTGRTGYTDTAASTGRTSWVVEANIGDMLSRGWELFKADYMKYIGVTLLMAIPSLIPAVQLVWDVLITLVPLPESILISYALTRAQGMEPRVGDVDRVFSMLVPLILVRVVSSILIAAGLAALLIPGIYLGVAYVLALPLVLDRGMGFWEAMETSRKVIQQRWLIVFGLVIILLLMVAISIATVVGWLAVLPFALCTVVALYEASMGIAGGVGGRPSYGRRRRTEEDPAVMSR